MRKFFNIRQLFNYFAAILLAAAAMTGWAQTTSVPTGITVTNVSSSTANLAWNASTASGVTGSYVIGYEVFRNGVKVSPSNYAYTGTFYFDNGLAASTNYSWSVASVLNGVSSAQSAPVSAQTAAPLMAAPTGVSTSNATSSSMKISWNAVPSNTSATFTVGYNVYRGGLKVNALPVYVTNFTDTGLAASTSYNWNVYAVDVNSVQGYSSNSASGTTLAGPPTCTTSSNTAHTSAGRAYGVGTKAYANGSNQLMGKWNSSTITTLKKTAPNYYVLGTCP